MKKGELLGRFIVLATNAHAGQFDKAGVPYILHCLEVMRGDDDDEELKCIKVGHDLFEDTDTTIEDLIDIGATERIIKGILALTKMPGESYSQYKAKVIENPDARKAKLRDLKHNSDITRMKGATEKDFKRVAKYHAFYAEIIAAEDV